MALVAVCRVCGLSLRFKGSGWVFYSLQSSGFRMGILETRLWPKVLQAPW